MSTDTFHCIDCEQDFPVKHDGGTGYALTDQGKVCYACCAERDKREMRERGKITLYLVKKDGHYQVTNWPGTLRLNDPYRAKHSRGYGFGRQYPRVDVWFSFEGQPWYGVNAGDSQILRARRIKA